VEANSRANSCMLSGFLQVKHWHRLSRLCVWYWQAMGCAQSCIVCWASHILEMAQHWIEVAYCNIAW